MAEQPYEPQSYWSRRLDRIPGLRATGHKGYDEAYNAWLYRHKGTVLRRELRRLGPRRRALDVGSGRGWVIRQLLDAGVTDVEGSDIAENVVEAIPRELGVPAFQLDLGGAPIPRDAGSYDLVTFIDVAFHIVDDDLWRAGVHDIARVLEPGGAMVVTDTFSVDEDPYPYTHVRRRTVGMWDEVAAEAGLRRVQLVSFTRWMGRRTIEGALVRRLPDVRRAQVEYVLERLVPRPPNTRLAVYLKDGSASPPPSSSSPR